MKITEHLYFYRGEELPPFLGLCTGNTYVIRGERLTLVDPGASMGPHLWRVERAMAADGLRFDNITRIIITHAHPDHAGGAARVKRRLTAPVYCHAHEKRVIEDPRRFLEDEYLAMGLFASQVAPLPRPLVELGMRIMFGPFEPVRDAVPVRHGTVLNLGIPAHIVSLPGHRPGEIGIHLPGDRALITGDLINHQMYDLPSLNTPLSDLKQAETSLRRIRELDIQTLAPGHDIVVTGRQRILEWLDAAIERCLTIRRRTGDILLDNPEIPLQRLGSILCGSNRGITFAHKRLIAYCALKALDPSDT